MVKGAEVLNNKKKGVCISRNTGWSIKRDRSVLALLVGDGKGSITFLMIPKIGVVVVPTRGHVCV